LLLNLLNAFQNRQDWLCSILKSGERCADGFSEEKYRSETYFADFKTGEIGPGRFSTALCAALKGLLSNRSKVFELAGF
jgi:hypothetical protein